MRQILPTDRYSPAAQAHIDSFHTEIVAAVAAAIEAHDVVVVGMAQNPHVRRARLALDEAGVAFTYLEYGSYFSKWQERLAIKMWSGWPTFPQVFVRGTLIGGNKRLRASLADGTFQAMLKS